MTGLKRITMREDAIENKIARKKLKRSMEIPSSLFLDTTMATSYFPVEKTPARDEIEIKIVSKPKSDGE